MEKEGTITIPISFKYKIIEKDLTSFEIDSEIEAIKTLIERRILSEFIQKERCNASIFELKSIGG